MDQDQIALARLLRLPLEFRERGDISIVELADELEAREWVECGAISAPSIRSHLDSDHSLIALWLDWSANKRCDSGSFFVAEPTGYFVADRIGGTRQNKRHHDDELEACADFVFRELRSWLAL